MIHTRSLTKDFVVSPSQGIIDGLSRAAARRRTAELVESLDLTDLVSRKVTDLSGGQRRRIDVAMGLVHAPSLLFLDEPTTGLDPQDRANLWAHLARMRAEHDMTILLTTHYLDEADSMAERVAVTATDTDGAARLAQLASRLPGARDVTRDGTDFDARVDDGPPALPKLLRAAHEAGVLVEAARVHRLTLDDVFLTLTGRSLREAGSGETTDPTTRKDAA